MKEDRGTPAAIQTPQHNREGHVPAADWKTHVGNTSGRYVLWGSTKEHNTTQHNTVVNEKLVQQHVMPNDSCGFICLQSNHSKAAPAFQQTQSHITAKLWRAWSTVCRLIRKETFESIWRCIWNVKKCGKLKTFHMHCLSVDFYMWPQRLML